MNFPQTHSTGTWLYFGIFAIIGMVFFILTIWSWMKVLKMSAGPQRNALIWSGLGYMFLFFGQWFACGIGAPPGNLMSPDPSVHNLERATLTASLSIFFAVPGWLCIFVSHWKIIKQNEIKKN